MGLDQLISISYYGRKVTFCSGSMSFSGSDSFDATIVSDYGVQVPSYVPSISFIADLHFKIIAKNSCRNFWRVNKPYWLGDTTTGD